jgi:uncharacterized protein (TIGR01244 family)
MNTITENPCAPHLTRRATRPARRTAQRWAAGSLLLAAVAALALFWMLAGPLSLQPNTLGINYVMVSARLGTAGMPTREQIARIAGAGYRVVINLAPGDALGSHADEAALVARAGMTYAHLPVNFAQPTAEDYRQFAALMKQHEGERVFVHCQIALRASVFTYLYRVLERGEDPDLAYEAVLQVWQPSHQWRELMRELHAARGRPLPFALDVAA